MTYAPCGIGEVGTGVIASAGVGASTGAVAVAGAVDATRSADALTTRELIREAVALLPALDVAIAAPEAVGHTTMRWGPGHGRPGGDPRYGLGALTALWLEADKTPHTRRAYYLDLSLWLDWCRRTGLDPLAARRADVDAWKTTLVATDRDGVIRPAAPASVARRLAAVSSWYRYLVSNEVAARNPFDAVRRPRTGDAPPLPALDRAETTALLAHAEQRAHRNATEASWRDHAVVSLLFHTGLRVSGLTGADLVDLDRDGGHVVLRYRRKGGVRDLVPLAPAARAALAGYLALRARRLGRPVDTLTGPLLVTVPRDAAGPGGAPSSGDGGEERVGCPVPGGDGGEDRGQRLTQRDVWRTLRTLARQAGLPSAATITPHTARRTAGTLLLAQGVPVQVVADLLGHRDIRTTRDRYDAHRHKLDSSPAYALAELLAAGEPPEGPTATG